MTRVTDRCQNTRTPGVMSEGAAPIAAVVVSGACCEGTRTLPRFAASPPLLSTKLIIPLSIWPDNNNNNNNNNNNHRNNNTIITPASHNIATPLHHRFQSKDGGAGCALARAPQHSPRAVRSKRLISASIAFLWLTSFDATSAIKRPMSSYILCVACVLCVAACRSASSCRRSFSMWP